MSPSNHSCQFFPEGPGTTNKILQCIWKDSVAGLRAIWPGSGSVKYMKLGRGGMLRICLPSFSKHAFFCSAGTSSCLLACYFLHSSYSRPSFHEPSAWPLNVPGPPSLCPCSLDSNIILLYSLLPLETENRKQLPWGPRPLPAPAF